MTEQKNFEFGSVHKTIYDQQNSNKNRLILKFTAAGAKELKDLEFKCEGDMFYKLGEGDSNHIQLPNDKQLLNSQLMIICKNGRYYMRDLSFVHSSRVKLDAH